MASGFFLGGLGKGFESGADSALADAKQRETERQNQIANAQTDRKQGLLEDTALQAQVRENVNGLVTQIDETVKALRDGGANDQQIARAVQPLAMAAKTTLARVGQDPSIIDAKVGAVMARPQTPTEGKWRSQVVEENPNTGAKKYALVNETTGEVRPGNAPVTPSTPRVVGTEEGMARGLYEPPPGSPAETVAMRFAPSLAQANPPSTMPAPAETPPSVSAQAGADLSPAGQTPEARRIAAEKYLQSGTFDTGIGRGRQRDNLIREIRNDAAALAKERGIDPASLPKQWQEFKGQQVAIQRFLSGPQGNTIRSLNVVTDHVETLRGLVDALKNNNLQAFNQLAQAWATQTGRPAPTNFNAARTIIGTEIVKSLGTAGGGALADRLEAAGFFDTKKSPAQLKGVIDDVVQPLLAGQLEGLRKQFKSATGLKEDRFDEMLAPVTKQFLTRRATKSEAPAAPAGGVVDWQTYFGQ